MSDRSKSKYGEAWGALMSRILPETQLVIGEGNSTISGYSTAQMAQAFKAGYEAAAVPECGRNNAAPQESNPVPHVPASTDKGRPLGAGDTDTGELPAVAAPTPSFELRGNEMTDDTRRSSRALPSRIVECLKLTRVQGDDILRHLLQDCLLALSENTVTEADTFVDAVSAMGFPKGWEYVAEEAERIRKCRGERERELPTAEAMRGILSRDEG